MVSMARPIECHNSLDTVQKQDNAKRFESKYSLWELHTLKVYSAEHVNAGFRKCNEKKHRKCTYMVIAEISFLQIVIVENSFPNHKSYSFDS